MDAITAITKRRVLRSFAARPVETEKLIQIIDAGRHAMSGRNLQPWQFIVVQEHQRLKRLGELCSSARFVGDAPSAVVVLKDRSNARWGDNDCAHAVQNMATAAWALGLGTCRVGTFDAPAIKALLSIPEGWDVFTVLPFGYPNPDQPPQSKPLKRRAAVVHFESYGHGKR